MKFLATSVAAVVVVIAKASSSEAHSNEINTDPNLICSKASWVGNHRVNSKGMLEATLTKQCTLNFPTVASIQTLYQTLNQRVQVDYTVQSGPVSEVYQGLSSQEYTVTLKSNDGGGTSVMHGTLRLATDQSNHLISFFTSNKVSGTGNGEYLKVYSEMIEVKKHLPESDLAYDLRITDHLILEKPWYAPTSIFQRSAESGIFKDFDRESNITASQIKVGLGSSHF